MRSIGQILIVDEVEEYCKVLSECLERLGYVVTDVCIHDQLAIEEAIREEVPEIVFVSFKTTQRATLQTFEWLQQQFPNIRKIMTSLYFSECVERESARLGVHGLIIKSCDLEQEIKAVLSYLKPYLPLN